MTSLDALLNLKQYYVGSTSNCGIFICNLTKQMYDQGVFDISSTNVTLPSSIYINPYMPSSVDLQKIYKLLMKSVNKTDNYTIFEYDQQCMIAPRNDTVNI